MGLRTAAIRVDGEKLRGCTKIPSRFHDRKPHRLDVTYCAEEAPPLFTELVNAEVLESSGDEVGSTVSIRALGTVDVAFPLFDSLILAVDGIRVPFSSDGKTHMGYTQLPIYGKHLLSLSKHQPS